MSSPPRFDGESLLWLGDESAATRVADADLMTRTIRRFPAILVGEGEWDGLIEWLRTRALADHRIEPSDLAELHVVSDPAQIARIAVAARERQLREGKR